MGRIRESLKEAINKFFGPSEPEKTFDEIAIADGVGAGAREELKATQNGAIGWKWYSEEQETPTKKGRQSGLGRVTSSRDKQPKQQEKSVQQRTIDDSLEL